MSTRTELDKAWRPLAKELGFSPEKGVHRIKLGEDWYGWLGLNSATYSGAGPVDVVPVIGVHWKPLEIAFGELWPEIHGKLFLASLSRPLGEVTDPPVRGSQWRVRSAAGEPFDFDAPYVALKEAGIPYMRGLCTPDSVVGKLTPPTSFSAHKEVALQKFPLALVLSDRLGEALSFVAERRKELEGKKDLPSKDFLTYADRFMEKYD